MAGDWAHGGALELSWSNLFLRTDGKLQWEEEATVNRLQSNEVPVSLGCPPWGQDRGEVGEFPAVSLPMGKDSEVTCPFLEEAFWPL